MKLYDYYRSSASYRVRIALNFKHISYETTEIHLTQQGGKQHSHQYQELNPQELVPTLNENGHILSQSLAIIEYLEEISPTPPLFPATPLGRVTVRSIAQSIACDIHPLNNLRVIQQLQQQFFANDDQIRAWYHVWLKRGFDALEKRLMNLARKNPVCYGSDISVADVCLIPQVYNAKRYHFALDNYPLIQEINEYCLTIPAFIEAAPQISSA